MTVRSTTKPFKPLDDGHGIDTKITKNINTIVWKYADIVEKEIKIEK